MASPMGSFLDSGSERGLESDSEESQSESTQVPVIDVMVSAALRSANKNVNNKRQRTSATESPGSSAPASDESHAEFDDEEEGLVAKDQYVQTLEYIWAKKKEFEIFKEDRKKERHDQMMELEKRKIELKGKDLELRQQIRDCNVMSMGISGMSERQQKYFRSLQDEIFARQFGAGSG